MLSGESGSEWRSDRRRPARVIVCRSESEVEIDEADDADEIQEKREAVSSDADRLAEWGGAVESTKCAVHQFQSRICSIEFIILPLKSSRFVSIREREKRDLDALSSTFSDLLQREIAATCCRLLSRFL